MAKGYNDMRAAQCIQRAQRTLGSGWNHVSDDIRWGLVAANILSVLLAQDETIASDRVRAMMAEMEIEARKLLEA